MMAGMFIVYIYIRCKITPSLGPALKKEELVEYEQISTHPVRLNYFVVTMLILVPVFIRFELFSSRMIILFALIMSVLFLIFRNNTMFFKDLFIKEKNRLLLSGTLPLVIFFAMMIPFIKGWTGLVESSAIGAMTAFGAAVLKGRMTREVFEVSVRQTLAISCMFMLIVVAALGFGAVFNGLGADRAIDSLFREQMGLSPWTILILMQLTFLVMGTFLDDTAMLVIVAPLYVPLVKILGFDLIWYGVLYTITTQIAYMTPPFGYNLFLMRAMAPKSITITDIYASIIPFVLVMVVALATIMAFPEIALWLPHYVYSR